MRILVIGKTGQLARSLQNAALPEDWALEAVGRPEADLATPELLEPMIAARTPDLVINAAAYTAVDRAETEPEAAEAINSTGVEVLAKACAMADIPLIHVSTDYVFDGSKPSPHKETDPTNPLGVYGRTKLAGEAAVLKNQPKSLIARTAWVFSLVGENFVKTMLQLAETHEELGVVDDQKGSPTYAPHLADALLVMARMIEAEPDFSEWGIYNVAGSGEATWCDLARTVFEISKGEGGPHASVNAIMTADYPTLAARPANSRLDLAKLRSVFGHVMPAWQDGTRACVKAFLTS